MDPNGSCYIGNLPYDLRSNGLNVEQSPFNIVSLFMIRLCIYYPDPEIR